MLRFQDIQKRSVGLIDSLFPSEKMFFKHLIVVLVIFLLNLVVLEAQGSGDKGRDKDRDKGDSRRDADPQTPKKRRSQARSSDSSIRDSYLAAIFDGSHQIGTGVFTRNYDVLCLGSVLPEKVLHLMIRFGTFSEPESCDIKEIVGVRFKGTRLVLLRPKNKENLKHLMCIDLPNKRDIRQIEKGPYITFQMVSSQSSQKNLYFESQVDRV